SFRTNLLINASLIFIWYCFSTGLSLYNKWLFGKSQMDFSFPLFTSGLHMLIQFILAGAIMLCLPGQRPRQTPSIRDYFTKVLPCAVATGLDIGLSNLSLRNITLSFYTMCKSSSLAFVLLFAFMFGLETLRLSLIGIIAMISVGVLLMAASEVEFVMAGFVQVMLAAAMSGLRWSLTQILLQDASIGINTPVASMFFLSPLMALCLFTGAVFSEDLHAISDSSVFTSGALATQMSFIIFLGGVLATLMVTAEYQLISRTSVVTLSVAGIFKEVVTIILSTVTFKDKLTPLNLVGLAITLLGIGIYKWIKLRK
ncbi:triose-phosphate transporter family-domain-containing protein, partial [Dimargaris cristalligena]